MAQLDEVVRLLNTRRQQVAEPAPAQPMQRNGFDDLVEALQNNVLRPHEFQASLLAIVMSMKTLAQQVTDIASSVAEVANGVGGVNESLGKKPESFDDVIMSVEGVHGSIQRLTKAIASIKLPEVNIPEIPRVDLSPIKSDLDEIKRIVSSSEVDEPGEVPKTRTWTFDIKRGPGGYIKSVEARAGDE